MDHWQKKINQDLFTLAQDLYDWNWTCSITEICYTNRV